MADISKITLNGTDYNVKDPSAQETLVSGTNIKTINNQSILGSGNLVIQGGGGSGPIIPAITTQAEYEAISGDVKTGDLIQVQDVVLDGYDGPQYGLFEAAVEEEESDGVVRKLISWTRKDSSNSVTWSSNDYPWMGDNGIVPIDLGSGSLLIAYDELAEDEAYNGIGFDGDGKPVITHIAPEYDDETGEFTGITREDTPIGGGGETVVELTQAQYDALSAYAPDTTYIITDAQAINMDDYATTADTEAIAEDVATISGSVANKADKANITARSSGYYFPRYNSQGIITGDTQAIRITLGINGTTKAIWSENSGNFNSVYAPTTVGTKNAVLLSNGSGAPVWASYKFQFITQTAYDALSTKDSTTIYFIIGD